MSSACPIRRSIGELLTHLHLWTILLTESPIDEVKAVVVEPFLKAISKNEKSHPVYWSAISKFLTPWVSSRTNKKSYKV